QGMQVRLAAIRRNVRGHIRRLRLTRYAQARDFKMPFSRGRLEAAMPSPAQRALLPGQIRPRRHRARVECKGQVSRQVHQIESALCMALEFSRLEVELELLRG